VSPVNCNAITFFNFQGQSSNRTHFRRYWGYVDNSMRVTLRIWSLIQSTSSGLHYINCVPSQLQCNYIFQFQGQWCNRTFLRCYWVYVDNSMRVTLRIWSLIQSTSSGLHYINCVPSQLQCNYIFQFQGQWSNRTCLRCYWVYVDNSMRVILRIWSVIRRTSCD
jgi:glutamate formiminotransferase